MKKAALLYIFIAINSVLWSQNSSVESLSPEEFEEMIGDYSSHCLIIDVREQRFYKLNRIENALWGGKKETLKAILDQKDKETPIFLYCDEGKRSEQAGNWVINLGFKNVYHLKGGIRFWVKKGYPIVKIED